MVKKIALVVLVLLLFTTGCTVLYDLWPSPVPKDSLDYIGKDANEVGWQSLRVLKDVREEVITKHILEQIDLKHLMEKDTALYARAIEQANLNIRIAQEERESTIGTLDSPGWLLGALLMVTGAGAYFVGYRTQRPEDYNENEYQKALRENGTTST